MAAVRLRYPDTDPDRPHYESVYLTAIDPAGGRAVWIRHTVLRRPGGPAVGSVWLTVFDAEQGPRALKQRFEPEMTWGPAAGGHVGHQRHPSGLRTGAEDWITIAGCGIGEAHASGEITRGERTASWSLAIERAAPVFDYLPRPWLYEAPLPRTKPSLPQPAGRFTGEVRLDGRRLELDGWLGVVGHNWGSEHPRLATWIHGGGFAEQPEARFDVVAARIGLGPLTTPWLANGAVTLDGETLRVGGLAPRATRLRAAPTAVRFTLTGPGVVVNGRANAPGERFAGWQYTDPSTGDWHPTLNCSIADMELTVERAGRPEVVLHCEGAAAYELQLPNRSHGLPLQPFPDP